jgi:nicotinate-nucleotide adenylyltransferase
MNPGKQTKRVGIYAGSFNPVHEGHIAFAREALAQCGLDKAFFLIEPRPRRKQGVKSLAHRQEMVRLALRHEKGLGAIFLNQERFYPITTMPLLRSRFQGAQLHMLMGDDVVAHLAHWPHVDEMLRLVNFVVGVRQVEIDDVKQSIDKLQTARAVRINYSLFEPSKNEYSSGAIRRQLKKGSKPSGLPEPVYQYIIEHNLYGARDS